MKFCFLIRRYAITIESSKIKKAEIVNNPGYHHNVDPNEVKKFSTLATDWWSLDGPCATLHTLNPVRLQFVMQHCNLRDMQVLDIGCGAGILSEALARHGAYVTGIDASMEVIATAKEHAAQSQLNIDYQAIYSRDFINQTTQQFDIITCMELLEHVPDPTAVLQDCYRLLKPGGHLFLATLNRNPKSYMLAIVAAEYVLNLLPKQTHDYAKLIRPAELAESLRTAKFKLIDLAGMNYQPFTKTATLCADVSVNYLAYARKEI